MRTMTTLTGGPIKTEEETGDWGLGTFPSEVWLGQVIVIQRHPEINRYRLNIRAEWALPDLSVME